MYCLDMPRKTKQRISTPTIVVAVTVLLLRKMVKKLAAVIHARKCVKHMLQSRGLLARARMFSSVSGKDMQSVSTPSEKKVAGSRVELGSTRLSVTFTLRQAGASATETCMSTI